MMGSNNRMVWHFVWGRSYRASVLVAFIVLMGLSPLHSTEAAWQDAAESSLRSNPFPWYDAQQDAARPWPVPEYRTPGSEDRNSVPPFVPRSFNTNRRFNLNWSNWFTGLSLTTWIVIAILIVGLLVFLLWGYSRTGSRRAGHKSRRPERPLEERIRELPFELAAQESGDFKSMSWAAFQAGQYERAIMLLFSHTLLTLDQHHWIRLQKGKTNRQYFREVARQPELARFYEQVMLPFERSFFGGYPLDARTYEQCWQRLESFEQQLERVDALSRTAASTTALPALLAASLLVAVGGCGEQPTVPATQYGRFQGQGYASSLNGTRVFRDMVTAAGMSVKRYDKLSPKIEHFETIFWFLSDRNAPPGASLDYLENWLLRGYDRTLVLVGRDYDADVSYWRDLIRQTTDERAKEFYQIQLAIAMANQDQARQSYQRDIDANTGLLVALSRDCRWYQYEEGDDATGKTVRGSWTQSVRRGKTRIEYNHRLLPPQSSDYQIEHLLRVDGKPFAYSLSRPEWDGGRIIVITNGSFLLNYGLINPEHRQLAYNLIDEISYQSDVLFLEAGSTIEIRSTEYENHNQWAWITHPPLRQIVPQLLFWGVMFSFVFFPIFGRARRTRRKPTSDFQDHIAATGRLLARTNDTEQAEEWLRQYRQLTHKERR